MVHASALTLSGQMFIEYRRYGAARARFESQLVVTRQDLQTEEATNRIKPGSTLPGMPHPDLIAPLVFDQDTLGMILVSKALLDSRGLTGRS